MQWHWLSVSHPKNVPSTVFGIDEPQGVCTISSPGSIGLVETPLRHGLGRSDGDVAKTTLSGQGRCSPSADLVLMLSPYSAGKLHRIRVKLVDCSCDACPQSVGIVIFRVK